MQIRKTLKKYNRISLRCEKWDIGMPVLLSTHTHSLAHSLTCSLARTHRYNLCLCERSNFSWVLPHTIPHHGATPSPHTAPIRTIQKQFSKLCSLPSLRPSGGTGNGKANPISFLGTQPGQMESAAACYLLRAPIYTHIPHAILLPLSLLLPLLCAQPRPRNARVFAINLIYERTLWQQWPCSYTHPKLSPNPNCYPYPNLPLPPSRKRSRCAALLLSLLPAILARGKWT